MLFVEMIFYHLLFFKGDVMDLTGVTFNVADAQAVGLLVLTGIAILWGVRRAISMANR